jgi:hypothetical protein
MIGALIQMSSGSAARRAPPADRTWRPGSLLINGLRHRQGRPIGGRSCRERGDQGGSFLIRQVARLCAVEARIVIAPDELVRARIAGGDLDVRGDFRGRQPVVSKRQVAACAQVLLQPEPQRTEVGCHVRRPLRDRRKGQPT